jgi:DNA replication and repair protein RecF
MAKSKFCPRGFLFTMSFEPSSQEFLKSLLVKNFRNIDEASLSFSQGHNLFVGQNGQGKTNFLEAISLVLALKPMHNFKNADLIMYEKNQAACLATLEKTLGLEISVEIFPHGKKVLLNQQCIKNASSLRKLTSVVSFIPEELDLITGTSSLRRRALDQAAAALYFEHGNSLRAYDKILLHRNKLFKSWPTDTSMLKSFTELLIKEGANIIYFRRKTIEHLQQIFLEKAQSILGMNVFATLQYYMNNHVVNNETKDNLMALLEEHHHAVSPHEPHRRSTLFGPHLDDVEFLINNHPAKKSISRGQSRALVLAFKLAHMMAIQQLRGNSPIVILDDIVSELDDEKTNNLLQVIKDLKTQSFFSGTKVKAFLDVIGDATIFRVREGALL